MNTGRSHPPALALWLLRRLCPMRNREAITGDLLERFSEGRSGGWFWRQVLAAIAVGAANNWRPRWIEIGTQAVGTVLIWVVPWGRIFPIAAMTRSMNWGWLIVIEIVTALMVLPLFGLLFHLRRTFGWDHLLRAFCFSAVLFAVGDWLTIRWSMSHPVISQSQGTSAVTFQLVWIFVTLLIAARFAQPLPFPSKTTSA